MKMKKLLAAALAATMLFSTMVTSVVASAADTVGTITAGTVNATVGETDTVTADINIAFPNGVVAPHNIITVALDGYTLSDVELGEVTYTSTTEGVVEIDADGSNLAAGKILLECPVDSKAPTVTAIALTATFTDSDDVDTVAGTYAIVVSGDDMTDVNEADIAISAVNGSLVVAEAAPDCDHANATYVDNEDGTHTATCPDCSNVETVEHSYKNAECACGAKNIDATLTFDDFAGALGVTPQFEIGFDISRFPQYADFDLIATRNTNDDSFNFKPIVEVVKRNDTYAPWVIWNYDTVELYSLTVPVTFQIRAYDENGDIVAYSNETTSTLKDVLGNTYNNTKDTGLKGVITDIFNLGAAAQTFVTSNAKNSDYAKLALPNDGWDQTNATTEMKAELATYNSFTNGDDAQLYLGAAAGASVYLELIVMQYGSDLAAYDVELSYYDAINQKTVEKTINLASTNTDEVVVYEDYDMIIVNFKDVAVYATNEEISINLLKNGVSIGSGSYCLDAFISENLTGPAGTVLQYTAYLSQSFRAWNGIL